MAAMVLLVTSCADAGTEVEKLDNAKIELQPTEEPVKTPDLQPAVTPIQPYDKKPKANTEPMEDWEKAYLEYLESFEGEKSYLYSFLYVDEDTIPELEINTKYAAGGSLLLTYHDGILDEVDIYRSGLYYIEKENLVCNGSGNTGSYFDYVYTIQDGRWKQIGCGEFWEDYENRTEDFIDFIYEWDGESVTEEEYEQRLQAVYPKEKSREPERYYIYDEICSLLKTGKVISADHCYELIEADMTWTEAAAACREGGGYLAAITSREEFERIQDQIAEEGKRGITFYIGAAYSSQEKRFFCLEPNIGNYDIDYYYIMGKNTYPFEEWSYRGLTEDGREVKEEFGAISYQTKDTGYYFSTVPNDLLDARPSLTGKIGYICEYDGWQEIPGTEHMGEWKKAYS